MGRMRHEGDFSLAARELDRLVKGVADRAALERRFNLREPNRDWWRRRRSLLVSAAGERVESCVVVVRLDHGVWPPAELRLGGDTMSAHSSLQPAMASGA